MSNHLSTKPPPSSLPPRRQRVSRSAPSSPVASSRATRSASSSNYANPTHARRSSKSHSKLIFESPRLEYDDHHLFPAVEMNLQTHDTRWEYLQRVAGQHKQDATCLNLTRNTSLTPLALRMGTPAATAQRVTELYLNVLNAGDEDSVAELPDWLDAIADTFPALRHLTLQQEEENQVDHITELRCDSSTSNQCVPADKYAIELDDTSSTTQEQDLSDAATVRRLYVLYRLPILESLDGIPIHATERRLACPRDREQERQHQEMTSCLLDVLEDEENMSRASLQSPKPRRGRPALSETAVEVDVNGRPLTGSPTARNKLVLTPPKRRLSALIATGTPEAPVLHCPALYDLDRIEYESVESTQVCEWSAACGTLSLPYFRKQTKLPDREKTKSRFHLKLRKTPSENNNQFEAERANGRSHPNPRTAKSPQLSNSINHNSRKSPPKRPSDPVMHVEDMNDHGEMIFEARPQRRRNEHPNAMPPSPHGKASTTLESLDFGLKDTESSSQSWSPRRLKPSPSESLSSPFPMQFRVRVKDTTARDLTVSTEFEVLTEAKLSPPPAPRDIDSARETIEDPISLARTHSSPTKLPSAFRKGELPPHGPERHSSKRITTRRYNLVRSNSTTKASQSKRRGQRWRVKLKARNTSIMDNDDDSDSSEEIVLKRHG